MEFGESDSRAMVATALMKPPRFYRVGNYWWHDDKTPSERGLLLISHGLEEPGSDLVALWVVSSYHLSDCSVEKAICCVIEWNRIEYLTNIISFNTGNSDTIITGPLERL